MVQKVSKVQKSISKKKGTSSLHPQSRDSRRLRRAIDRDERVLKAISVRSKQNRPILERIQFFRQNIQDSDSITKTPKVDISTIQGIQRVISDHLSRFDEEISTLETTRRPGRPPSTQESSLRTLKAAEEQEYRSGLWVPDVTNSETTKRLKDWNGEWTSLSTLTFLRVYPDGMAKASSFPPRKD